MVCKPGKLVKQTKVIENKISKAAAGRPGKDTDMTNPNQSAERSRDSTVVGL